MRWILPLALAAFTGAGALVFAQEGQRVPPGTPLPPPPPGGPGRPPVPKPPGPSAADLNNALRNRLGSPTPGGQPSVGRDAARPGRPDGIRLDNITLGKGSAPPAPVPAGLAAQLSKQLAA